MCKFWLGKLFGGCSVNVRELFHGLPNLEIKCHRQMNYFGFQSLDETMKPQPPQNNSVVSL